MVYGPPAGVAGSVVLQSPFSSVFTVSVCITSALSCRLNETVISSPSAAQPHIGAGMSRCITMSFPKICGRLTSAKVEVFAKTSIEMIRTKIVSFMLSPIL